MACFEVCGAEAVSESGVGRVAVLLLEGSLEQQGVVMQQELLTKSTLMLPCLVLKDCLSLIHRLVERVGLEAAARGGRRNGGESNDRREVTDGGHGGGRISNE